MKAQTQELIERNLRRVAEEGGTLAAQWDSLSPKAQRRWVTTWQRIEREEAAYAAESALLNSDAPYSASGLCVRINGRCINL